MRKWQWVYRLLLTLAVVLGIGGLMVTTPAYAKTRSMPAKMQGEWFSNSRGDAGYGYFKITKKTIKYIEGGIGWDKKGRWGGSHQRALKIAKTVKKNKTVTLKKGKSGYWIVTYWDKMNKRNYKYYLKTVTVKKRLRLKVKYGSAEFTAELFHHASAKQAKQFKKWSKYV